MVHLAQIWRTYTFQYCHDTGMQNEDETLLSISLASHSQLVNMLIALEPHGIFSLSCAYLYILRLSLVYQIK